jgi:hypothetical protein
MLIDGLVLLVAIFTRSLCFLCYVCDHQARKKALAEQHAQQVALQQLPKTQLEKTAGNASGLA